MHTEDDTFKALRRIPFRDMRSKVTRAKIVALLDFERLALDELLEANGWTRGEYMTEWELSLEGIIIKPANPYKVHHE